MASPMHDVMEGLKPAGDILSIGVVLATLASWLPSIAALFTIVWTSIRIYESDTVQAWLGKAKASD
jgi:chromate transport protein ChrA